MAQPEARSRMSELGMKAIAALVLAVAAYLVFKVVVGVVTAVAWIIAVGVGIVAVLWALSVLRR